jgi:SlyX protein
VQQSAARGGVCQQVFRAALECVDALTRQLAELKELVREAASNAGDPVNEPPPHY